MNGFNGCGVIIMLAIFLSSINVFLLWSKKYFNTYPEVEAQILKTAWVWLLKVEVKNQH